MPFVLNFENARKGDEACTSQKSGLRFRAELSEWDIKEFFDSAVPFPYAELQGSYLSALQQFRVATQKCLTSLPPEPNATRIMERCKHEEIRRHGRLDFG